MERKRAKQRKLREDLHASALAALQQARAEAASCQSRVTSASDTTDPYAPAAQTHIQTARQAATALNFTFSTGYTTTTAPIQHIQTAPAAPSPSDTVQIPRAAFAAHAIQLRRVFGIFKGMSTGSSIQPAHPPHAPQHYPVGPFAFPTISGLLDVLRPQYTTNEFVSGSSTTYVHQAAPGTRLSMSTNQNDDDQLTWDQSLEGHYPSPGNYNQRSLAPLYPGPRDYHSAAQEAYPAHQPVYTRPYIPTFDAIRTPAAAVQQDAPANTEVLQTLYTESAREEMSIETKKQKADDKKYRDDLRQERDEIVSRLSEMGHRMIPDGTEQAEFEQLIISLTDLNHEIDISTEENIDYYSIMKQLKTKEGWQATLPVVIEARKHVT
ncbi:hypothetical protein KCU91_g7942, partial [Aureobasidium melanogenum]